MKEAVLVMAKRTPVGKIGGQLSTLEPEQLLAPLIRDLVTEAKLPPEWISDVIIGNTVGPGGNIARKSVLEAGLPVSVPGVTIDRQCGSGLEAIIMAARFIQCGAGDLFLAGGVESASRAPWKLLRPAALTGTPTLYTRAPFTPAAFGDPDMGLAAEHVADKYGVSREEQDRYALESHLKAVHAQRTGRYAPELVPLQVNGYRITADECPRPDTSLEKLRSLPPVFAPNGTVTAGNACPVNDGAALALMMSRETCEQLSLTPVLRFVDSQAAGVDPRYPGIGPVPAVRQLLSRQRLNIDDVDIVEFNEAFASQVLASLRELQLPREKVNPGGGALALGHPYGASGAILMTRLYSEMLQHPYRRGLATLGIGGGMGLAVLVEPVL
ncbi:thiolase family protein [Paenibacillus tritici]|uniref:Thiolase family protein n=1 Tax=Paenibacillus tritici TaxID=1873425 RepID=A0ABX2DTZ3_9BACL|nr:thiolase family protein [Paenibacillus tritici]NQX47845.1 thiolase family protein [Paenibacillus tritici]